MLPVLWHAETRQTFPHILEYIAERNPAAATALYDDIERAISQLPHAPFVYRLGRIAGTRELVIHPNYIVVYCVGAAAIEIVAVLHSRQQYP